MAGREPVIAGRPLDTLGQADFAHHLGTVFRLRRPDGGTLELTLLEASPHPHLPHAPGRRQGFSVVFRSAWPAHLPQGIYRLDHDLMGSLDLFLVPVGPREGAMFYEAVFN
jgi:hypothetical protein